MEFEFGVVGTFALLVGLEVVLGLDNLVVLTMTARRVASGLQNRTRILGIVFAAGARMMLLYGASVVASLREPLFYVGSFDFSWRDVILVTGGAFLVSKAVSEIHAFVQSTVHPETRVPSKDLPIHLALAQIVLLDLVFSVDSTITAVGLTNNFLVAAGAIAVGAAAMFTFVGKLSSFLESYPSFRILALALMMAIGFTLGLEAFNHTVPKQYLYAPLLFAVFVQVIQIVRDKNIQRQASQPQSLPAEGLSPQTERNKGV